MKSLQWTLCFTSLLLHGWSMKLEHGFVASNDGENNTWKDVQLKHRIKDSSYLLNNYPMEELSPDVSVCRKPAKCIPLHKNSCMGTKLPYSTTTLNLIPESVTQDIIEERLYLLQALKHVPKCWAVVQPFLCSIFMPKCVNNTVELPSQEMCKMVSGPCRLLLNHTIWPSFAKCDNAKLFPRLCKNDVRELKFNTSGKCLKPLVPTDNALSIFDGVEGCGTQCYDPLYTSDEHSQIHSFIAWAAGICCAFNLFAILTFLIDWRSANKYPSLEIFYINGCFMVSCIGWLAQFAGSREVIVCRKDGTLRMGEPSGENLSCVVVFVLVYYFLMAAMVWFVILTYTVHSKALRKMGDRIDKKGAYFHLIAWCLPLVLTVTIMALGEIDGNSVTGICFVGYVNHMVRVWFVLGPVFVVVLVGGYFLHRGLYTLICYKISCPEISKEMSSKIRHNIVRIGVFSMSVLAAVIVTFYCHVYEIQYSWQWKQSFRDYMICAITTKYSDISECKMDVRPSMGKLQLHLFALFFTGILMSSWVWTSSTVDTWCRFLRSVRSFFVHRIFKHETEEVPIRLSKHKLIARLFANRKTFNKAGRLSISFHNAHEDPVGLNFGLSSAASQDLSSTWAAALPKLMTRRGALVDGTTGSVSSNRRNSVDSEISYSYKCVSMESRRNSLDSQISVQIAQVTRKVAGRSRGRRGKSRRDFGKSRSRSKIDPPSRRDSTTSQDSQLMTQISVPVPNMGRRLGNAGLEERALDSKVIDIKNAGMLLPFLFPRERTGSDENLSSEDKKHQDIADQNVDETGNMEKEDEPDSTSEDSQPEEEMKMLDLEEAHERNKSKSSNKNCKVYNHEVDRRNRESSHRSKYVVQHEAILKQLLQEANDLKAKNENEEEVYKKAVIGDLNSSLASCRPELTRLLQNDGQTNAREIATQTSLPLDILEMEELKQSIDEIINSRHCSSKGTQISPQLKKSKNII
ncbi:protein smoothened isoform X3 [Ooceraea biroi]|uniref:protein smoothened isoform X3 n=1 Tax=Ooceraea biroi TaxID=2015173 RepID=UPI000F096C59|nr:protein smoothened isoform X3 [Ooceraea biroi]